MLVDGLIVVSDVDMIRMVRSQPEEEASDVTNTKAVMVPTDRPRPEGKTSGSYVIPALGAKSHGIFGFKPTFSA